MRARAVEPLHVCAHHSPAPLGDVLDYHSNRFDRDFVEFNVRVSELEAALQRFINSGFESISSIDASLAMLKKFQTLLQRDSLKQDLGTRTGGRRVGGGGGSHLPSACPT